MSAFQPFLQHFAAASDTASCQDYEEKGFAECFSEETPRPRNLARAKIRIGDISTKRSSLEMEAIYTYS